VLDADDIAAAVEGVGLGELDATLAGGLEAHREFVAAGGERRRPLDALHRRPVVRQRDPGLRRDQARLGLVDALGAAVEQQHVALVVFGVEVVQQFQPHQTAADAVEGGPNAVGGDDGFAAGPGRRRRCGRRWRRAACRGR
jgi:hypothetical protein